MPVPGAGDLGASKAYADGVKRAKGASKWKRGVRVKGYYYRGGYYSYTDADAIDSRAWARSLFISQEPLPHPVVRSAEPWRPVRQRVLFRLRHGAALQQLALSALSVYKPRRAAIRAVRRRPKTGGENTCVALAVS